MRSNMLILHCVFSLIFLSFFIKGEWVQRSVSPLDQTYTASTWVSNGTVIAVNAKSSGYIVQSNDYGETWTKVATNITASSFFAVSSRNVGGNTYIITADDSGNVFYSTGSGTYWTSLYQLPTVVFGVTLGSNGLGFFGGLNSIVVLNITTLTYVSRTVATTSIEKFFGITSIDGVNIIAVSTSGKIYYSKKNGKTFTQSTQIYATDGSKSSSTSALYAAASGNSSLAFAAGSGGKVFRTEDYGVTWRACNSPFLSSDLIQYQALSVLQVVKVYAAGSVSGEIYKSNDKCNSWTLLSSTGVTLNSLSMLSSINGVAGASAGNGIFALVPGTRIFCFNYS